MRYLLTVAIGLLWLPLLTNAQKANPYESIGKKTAIVTLSNGRYQETFDDDTLQRIGSVIIDRRTRKIVQMLDADSISKEASDNSTSSRWYSIDPLAEKYYSYSPYAFCGNNPVKFIDPDGNFYVNINGAGAAAATDQLDKSSSLTITRNQETGRLNATGTAQTPADLKLKAAIDDPNVTVSMDATNSNYRANGDYIVGGSFDGSKVIDGRTEASQTVNPVMTSKKDALYGEPAGTSIKHEVLEAYIGAVESPGTTPPTFQDVQNNTANGQAYSNAHNKAMSLDPQFKEPIITVDQNDGKVYINRFDPKIIPDNLNTEILINDRTK